MAIGGQFYFHALGTHTPTAHSAAISRFLCHFAGGSPSEEKNFSSRAILKSSRFLFARLSYSWDMVGRRPYNWDQSYLRQHDALRYFGAQKGVDKL